MVKSKKSISVLLLFAFAGVITIILQAWVGMTTIYSQSFEERRLNSHNAILKNIPPDGYSWENSGASGMNRRILVILIAEMVHKITNYEVYKVYILIDSICIFVIIIVLFVYLKKWLNNLYCTIGILYFSSIMPLTYFLHAFHPWDRLSLLIWILLLYLLREKKILAFAIILAISITIKYDTVLLPGLYFLCTISRQNWRKTLLITTILVVLSFGLNFLLAYMFPGDPTSEVSYVAQVWEQVKKNIGQMLGYDGGIKYPPLLGFSIPILLSIWGIRAKDRFILACVIFGGMLVMPWFLLSNFIEIRAEMPLLLLLLPSSLMGLQCILDEKSNNIESQIKH